MKLVLKKPLDEMEVEKSMAEAFRPMKPCEMCRVVNDCCKAFTECTPEQRWLKPTVTEGDFAESVKYYSKE